jgi:GxxExxY protein
MTAGLGDAGGAIVEAQDKRDPRTYAILGAAMEVHAKLHFGFAEPIYQDSLEIELALRSIPFEREPKVVVYYKGQPLRSTYRPDFVCYGEVVVELKALDRITNVERAQVINYLKATGYKVALLINFGALHLEYERIVL